MASLVRDLIEAGIHFGQRSSNWNPKMQPYIFGARKQIHIIDIKETIKGLLLAKKFIARTVGDGKDVVFVGTKRQARGSVEKYATDVKMPYVVERWLGGTLTNFRTIRERLKRLTELEALAASEEFKNYSKKMQSQLTREYKRLKRNLEGIRTMDKLPGCIVVIDTNREINALREAHNLGVPTIALIDTDGNPDLVDIPIPGNDDSMRSIDVVIRELCAAVSEGKQGRPDAREGRGPIAGGDAGDRDSAGQQRRSRRSQFRADENLRPAPIEEPAATGSPSV
jgi:small subunit ribosomal protein S2